MTKLEKYATLFIVICLMILETAVCCKISHRRGYSAGWVDCLANAKSDTVVVVDTLRIAEPVAEYVYIDRVKPVYLPVHDTSVVVKRDTAFIAVNREIKGYSGADYKLEVSGVQPALDWIEVYPRITTITNTITEKAPRWSFGATAGPGVFWSGEVRFGIGVVAGVSYRF